DAVHSRKLVDLIRDLLPIVADTLALVLIGDQAVQDERGANDIVDIGAAVAAVVEIYLECAHCLFEIADACVCTIYIVRIRRIAAHSVLVCVAEILNSRIQYPYHIAHFPVAPPLRLGGYAERSKECQNKSRPRSKLKNSLHLYLLICPFNIRNTRF